MRLGIAGSIALIWASLGVFSAVRTAVNHAWGVERQRSYLKHKLVSFLMMLAAGTILMITVILIGAGQVVGASWFGVVLERFPALLMFRGLGVRYGATLLLIFGVGLVFYFIPNAKVRFRDVWVGAIVTGCSGASRLRASPGTCATCRASASTAHSAQSSSSCCGSTSRR